MANSGEGAAAPVVRKGYFAEVWNELKKTTWPSWPEAWRLTVVVLGVIVAVAVYIGIIDGALSMLVEKFQLIK